MGAPATQHNSLQPPPFMPRCAIAGHSHGRALAHRRDRLLSVACTLPNSNAFRPSYAFGTPPAREASPASLVSIEQAPPSLRPDLPLGRRPLARSQGCAANAAASAEPRKATLTEGGEHCANHLAHGGPGLLTTGCRAVCRVAREFQNTLAAHRSGLATSRHPASSQPNEGCRLRRNWSSSCLHFGSLPTSVTCPFAPRALAPLPPRYYEQSALPAASVLSASPFRCLDLFPLASPDFSSSVREPEREYASYTRPRAIGRCSATLFLDSKYNSSS